MTIIYDITTDLRYLEGVETGIETGIEKEKNRAIRIAIIKGKLSLEEIAEMFSVDLEYVLKIKETIEIMMKIIIQNLEK